MSAVHPPSGPLTTSLNEAVSTPPPRTSPSHSRNVSPAMPPTNTASNVSNRPWLGLGTPGQLAAVLLLLGVGAAMALTVNGYWVFVLANVALLAVVGIGLKVLLGLSGQVSFGHVGFFAIGAYTVAILTTKAGVSFWLAWPLAAPLLKVFMQRAMRDGLRRLATEIGNA